jgi:succinate dehydrogenase / fumarate reductase membrane anchor subunit
MVAIVTGLGRTGLQEFVIQRITSLILIFYVFFMVGFFILNKEINFFLWCILFNYFSVKVFTLLTLLSLIAHAWIGIWTIITDYITIFYIRFFLQIIINLLLIIYLIIGVETMWSI